MKRCEVCECLIEDSSYEICEVCMDELEEILPYGQRKPEPED